MFISKDITVGQAAVIASAMRYIPSEFYVEDGKLKKERKERNSNGMFEALGKRLGFGHQLLNDDDEVTVIDSCDLPDVPVAMWRVMRQADRTVGRLKSPIIRDARGLMSCEELAISKEGIWVFGNIVATWGPGKNQLDKYEFDNVAAALIGRCELFCVQTWKLVERDVIVKADLNDDNPAIKINPALIEWLREWVPGGYSMLKSALTNPDAAVRVGKVEEIVGIAVGHAFEDVEDFEPAETLNHIAALVGAGNYSPYVIDEDDCIDFTTGNANTDVAEKANCGCGKCPDEVVTTFGYRGVVRLVSELGAFSTMPVNMGRFTASHNRLRNFLAQNRMTAYEVVADGITDETVNGWTDLHMIANEECATVQ